MKLQKLTPWNWFRDDMLPSAERLPSLGGDDAFTRMHREMDRMLETFLGSDRLPSDALVLKPSIDIAESKKAYRISVEVPGIEPGDIDLKVEDDMLVISGEKRREAESDEEGFHRVERSYGEFRRVLTLPEDADVEHIKAEFHNGVLKVRVPRLEVEKRPPVRKVEIEG